MKRHTSVLIALLSMAASTILLPQVYAQSASRHTPTPRELLGLGVHHAQAGTHPNAKAVIPGAKVYRFASADFPGQAGSLVFDENTSTVLGDSGLGGGVFAFTLKGGLYQQLSIPNSAAVEATGINTSGEIVGIYEDLSSVQHGFLKNGATVTNVDIGLGGTTEPFDINDSGEIVGTFIDSAFVSHGFYSLDGGVTFALFDGPSAQSTLAAGVNLSGTIVGGWTDASGNQHAFKYKNGTFTSFDFPGATSTTAIGINDSGAIAGFYEDASFTFHGFVFSAGSYSTVDVAGATQTELTRIKNNGNITGLYIDSMDENHGLTGH